MHKFVRNLALAPIALALASLSNFDAQGIAQAAKPGQRSLRHRASAPRFTGSDGSTTGVAKFEGNLTAITAPSGQVLALSRGPNCSLLFLSGTYSNAGNFTYAESGMTPNYERILHAEAGLTTTADSVPAGCVDPTLGIGARPTVKVGETTTGVNVYAGLFYNVMTGTQALYTLTGQTMLNVTVFNFPRGGLVATADLNGDGNGDLVVINGQGGPGSAQVYVLLGNPDGSFQTAVSYSLPGSNSAAAVIDDFNGDGKLDIVATSDTGYVSLLTGKGDGSFSAAQSVSVSTSIFNVISADLRGTGHKDLVGSNGLVLFNDGAGNFTQSSVNAFPLATSLTSGGPYLASGDFNRDGKTDIVISTGDRVLTYLGKGDGTFTPGQGYVTVNTDGFVTVTDLDGDGNADIYIGDANGGLFRGDNSDTNLAYALMGKGDGSFQGAPTIGGAYVGTNLGDVNGDGMPDLIVNNPGQFNEPGLTFTVELGTAKGAFSPAATIALPAMITITGSNGMPVTLTTANASISSYAVGDVNGDGNADLALVANFNGDQVYLVSLSNGDGTFATPVGYAFPQIAPSTGYDFNLMINSIHIADLNHDGKADLIFNFYDQAEPGTTYLEGFAVLPGNGDGTFSGPIVTYSYDSMTNPGTGNNAPTIDATVDLNGDGIPDLVATSGSFAIVNGFGNVTSTIQVYLGKGDGTFDAPAAVASSYFVTSVVVADLNHDGKLDIACLGEAISAQNNTSQGQLFIALGKGDGTFNTATTFNLDGGDTVPSSGLTAADFDGDGNVDLAYLNPESFSGIFYGKGDGTFTSVPIGDGAISPKDLVNLTVGSSSGTIALDLNKDGRPDILTGNAVLLNIYGTATATPLVSTTTVLAVSATSVSVGTLVTFTATVAPGAGGTGAPSGTVTFMDGSAVLGSGMLVTGSATYATSALAIGAHSITAVYTGDSSFSGSTSSATMVNVTAIPPVATTTAISSTPAGTAAFGTNVTLSATVRPSSGTAAASGSVTFSDGSTALGSGLLDATGTATFSTSTLAAGSHRIIAAYAGTATFSPSTSPALTLAITPPPAADFSINLTSATVTLTGPSAATNITVTPISGFNQAVSLSCTGAPANTSCSITPSSVTPSGGAATATVLFVDSATSKVAAARFSGIGLNFQAAAVLPIGVFGAFTLLGLRNRRRRWTLLLFTLSAAIFVGAAGCGGHSRTNSASGKYVLTITASSGAITHSTAFTVIVP